MEKSENPKAQESNFRAKGFLPKERRESMSQSQSGEEGVILLAEDREEEVMLLRRAFAKASFLNPLHVVPNGEEAIAYLQGEGKYVNRDEYPLPTLVLLD